MQSEIDMPADQLVFMACPAFVSRVRGQTTCDFQLTESDYDETAAISIDLQKNVLGAAWDEVQVDAGVSASPPGLTSIGPTFHIGGHKGVVYLEMGLCAALRTAGKMASWPPAKDQVCQYQNVVRKNASGGFDRFHGFAAKVLKVCGTVAQVAVFKTGSATPQRELWLDLADPASCDPPENGMTTVVPAAGSQGALFLSWSAINANEISVPKLPPGEGTGALPAQEDP